MDEVQKRGSLGQARPCRPRWAAPPILPARLPTPSAPRPSGCTWIAARGSCELWRKAAIQSVRRGHGAQGKGWHSCAKRMHLEKLFTCFAGRHRGRNRQQRAVSPRLSSLVSLFLCAVSALSLCMRLLWTRGKPKRDEKRRDTCQQRRFDHNPR